MAKEQKIQSKTTYKTAQGALRAGDAAMGTRFRGVQLLPSGRYCYVFADATAPAQRTEAEIERTMQDAIGHFQVLPVEVLAAILRGEVDALAVAARTLADAGLDENGKWVGFNKSAEIHADNIARQPKVATIQPR